jgi:transposase
MRICLISREYPPDTGFGGIATFTKHLAHGLKNLGHEVVVVALAKDKAKVEKAVQEVERQILAPLRHQQFNSFSELNEAIRPLLQRLNERVMSDYGLSRLAMFERVDQPALKPLPKYPFIFANWKRAKVNLDYHIEVEKHYYSVPYWYVRQEVNAKVSEQVVEIFYEHQRIALHLGC